MGGQRQCFNFTLFDLHSSGSELPSAKTQRILFSHPLFLFLWTILSNITVTSDLPSVKSASVFPVLKASLIIATWSAENFVHVDLSASLSQITDLRFRGSDATVCNVPFVSTFAFFALTVSAVASCPSELAKIKIIRIVATQSKINYMSIQSA